MKILKIAFDHIGLFEEGVSIDLTAADRVTDLSQVQHVFKTIYTQKILAITGANASGKTTLLRLMNLALKVLIYHSSLNELDIPEGIIREDSRMIVDFYNDDKFFRLESVFGFTKIFSNSNRFYFKEEIIYSKKKSEVQRKDDRFSFKFIELKRSSLSKEIKSFLKPEDSIVIPFTNNELSVIDTMNQTNFNLHTEKNFEIMEFVNLFDHSIEKLDFESDVLKIKYKNSKEEYIAKNILEREVYLSSGTIRGNQLLRSMIRVLRLGGYFIIDEIENHLHKKLVQFIMEIFTDEAINVKGATLIFTTHYSEITDSIERKDNIYVLRRDKKYVSSAQRFSDVVKRNDLKKSDVLISNYIEGTTPSYEQIKLVRDILCELKNF